ncbi:hypothetical protein QQX10_06540 [Demequina sp. SYSU T00039]|uniref:Uncharacterized protein n=1 Tax=Demequina lignilytica TaxID=3051663 RepID=A0AAW7M4T4_9MICO|nr:MULTISPECIES: hypothetical protein [unclassified Demequina]MDN4477914.1 hypothetical protein [Demequina sp. SYSU T00039-1]MDN4487823.1 hypothetical protein [Demequina sp. SYSU T00039]MDN4490794.1 hypothetical protein [Demequina sp. SYSU T00068]
MRSGAERVSARRRLAAAGCAIALAGAGCDTAAPAPLEPPAPLEASATLTYPRTLQADRMVEVRVSSTSEGEVRVTAATLQSGYFADVPATEREVRVWEGHEARIRVALGEPVCPAGVGAADDARVALSVAVEGTGVAQEVAVPTDVLAAINAAECTAHEAIAVAAPALGAPGEAVGGTLATTLVLERAQRDVPVTVTAIAGSVIFAVDTEQGALPATLAADQGRLEVPVSIRVARCEPHAFAESKKTFLFKTWLEAGEADEAYVELYAEGDLRDALQALVDACGEEARGEG